MSRFDVDNYDDEPTVPWAFWEQAIRRSLHGKRALKSLTELHSALMDLPRKRLISGALAHDGAGVNVCAIGALLLRHDTAKGKRVEEAIRYLAEWNEDEGYGPWDCAYEARRAGITPCLAYKVQKINDETFIRATPEERYAGVLSWVEEQIERIGRELEAKAEAIA